MEPAALPLETPEPANLKLSAFSSAAPSPMGSALAGGANPKLSAFCSDPGPPQSVDTNPADRRGDRLLAYLGLLDDAAPLFGSGTGSPRAGVLLALPALISGGVFECAQKIYGSLGPAFAPGRSNRLETRAATLYLAGSSIQGSGPSGPSVTLTLDLSFKPQAAGRSEPVEVRATNDAGGVQGFDHAATLTVERRHR